MNEIQGFILIDKPKGITSHKVIEKLRKITGIKKIGHAGTLDPIASGLLIVAIGRKYTKQISKFVKLDKVYFVTAKLGIVSNTYDIEGKIEFVSDRQPMQDEIENCIQNFTGEIEQIPPMFSAKKVKGKKLYELARKGIEITREPIKITIFSIKILNYEYPFLELEVHCSSGTYIRSLVNDIGKCLKTGAIVYELRRLRIGNFNVGNSLKYNELNLENIKNFNF